jgi:DNA polymerase-3 subunit beta
MEFNVSSKVLYNAAAAVSKVINSKNTMVILDNFLMTLDGEVLHILGTDVENAVEAHVPVQEASGSGSFCVNARRMVELLKEIPEQGLSFKIDDNLNIKLDYASGTYNFAAQSSEDYPSYKLDDDEMRDAQSFKIPASVLSAGIGYTLFAVSTDEYRAAMMGVFMNVKRDSIDMVATDTRKLVKYTNTSFAPGVDTSCIIPVKQATILKNIFGADDEIAVTMTSKCATFTTENISFNCRFINGMFPDYNRVIPRNNSLELSIDRASFFTAVRRVGLFCAPGYGLVKLKITPDQIELKAQDSNMMTVAHEKVPCSFSGNQLVIGFSAPYLVDIFGTLQSQNVSVFLSDPARPGIFKPTEVEDNTEVVMLLMPMTVGEY